MKRESGFTLIELLVVMAVFSTLMLVVTDIFVNVSQSQRRTVAWEKAQNELRYAMEFMAQAVRTGHINYAYAEYADGIGMPEAELAYGNDKYVTSLFRRKTSGCDGDVMGCIEAGRPIFLETGLQMFNLTGNQVEVTRLDFYITPTADPFTLDPLTNMYGSNEQPKVTIILEGHSVGPREADQKDIHLETTVTTRYYER
jgi:prepilin-type N-terminal cleavage/methylation domain-containing protein